MNKLQALELSTGLSNLVTGMEDELLKNIAAYLLSGKAETETSKWKIRKLAELGKLNQKNIETIKSYVPYEKDLAELTIKRAAVDAFAHAETGFRKLVIDGLVKDAPTGSMDKTMRKTLTMLGKQAANDLNLVNTTMQIKAKQMANTAIHNAADLAESQPFLDMLGRAAGKNVTGTESLTAAVSTCLKDMAQKGIPAFVDKSGRKWTPEAYVNMCVRTTASNVGTQAMFERMKDYKSRIIEVSSHSGARPKCAKDQGKLYDLDNDSGYVEDANGKKIRYYPFSSTSYGKPDGLFGINCRHKMYPFVPKCSTQKYFPYDDEENAAEYKRIQKQRQLERNVRAAKRECMMLKDGDPEMFQKASVKLKNSTRQLKSYCDSNDLMYMNERTSVMGYGRSEAGRVTAAYNRELKDEEKKLNFGKEELLKEKNVTNNISLSVNESDLLEKAENDLSVLPQRHRKIIDNAIKRVVLTDDTSGYSRKSNTLFINTEMNDGDMVHEAGHVIFHELNIQEDEKYQRVLKKGIENVTNYDIIENKDYEKPFYQLVTESDKFVSDYQKRVYSYDPSTVDWSAQFDFNSLREYFSEGYRAFFKSPELLKEKDNDLYEYIRRLVDDD